jgi:flagellin-like protein
MKGISAVIATLLMLMITVALAGTAYMYISGMFSSSKQCMLVVDKYCTSSGVSCGGVQRAQANFVIRNICTDNITSQTITVTRTNPSQATCPPPATCCPDSIPPRSTRIFNDSYCVSGGQCSYRFLGTSGQAVEDSIYCS